MPSSPGTRAVIVLEVTILGNAEVYDVLDGKMISGGSVLENSTPTRESKPRTVKSGFISFRGSIFTMSRSVISGDDVVEQLLATDSVNVRDIDSQTALLWAAKKGQLPLVERLLDRGRADPTDTNIYNQTPLLWAATNGHKAVVQLLVARADVDPDHSDEFDQTVLWAAAFHGHRPVVELLSVSSSSATTASCPPHVADESGVQPLSSLEFESTLFFASSCLTTALCPFLAV